MSAAADIYAAFRSLGATPAQACGIMANIKTESDFNPGAVGDHGTAHGLCQWHPDRVAEIQRGCGINVRTAGVLAQVKAIMWELQHVETDAWHAVQRATTPYAAAAAFCEYYERPANVSHEVAVRGMAANALARQFTH